MLEVKHLDSGYGYLQVVWDVSLEVAEGEFVALLGPNGAGKSTILSTIAGLINPVAGEVSLYGKRIDGLPAHEVHRMGISLVPEALRLFPVMTVRENLLVGAYTVRDRKRMQELFDSVLGLFPVLQERAKQLAGTLSGGERKMLAIGRSLMSDPRLLLVDEPSLGLAPQLVLSVFEALERLNEQGVTILLVEQNVETTLRMTHRGYVVEQGRIVLQGPSADLLTDGYVKKAYLGMS